MNTAKALVQRQSLDLSQKELNMLKKTTKYDDKEIRLWHTEFLKNFPNGKMDKATFAKNITTLYPKETAQSANAVFDSIDTNKDGTVDFNEFLFSVAVSRRQEGLDERLETIFNLWDVSDDGQIDISELAHLVSAMYGRSQVKDRQGEHNPQTRAKAIIAKLDLNNDKKINREEFIKGCKNDETLRNLLAPN